MANRPLSPKILARMRALRAILLDVDGVLTDNAESAGAGESAEVSAAASPPAASVPAVTAGNAAADASVTDVNEIFAAPDAQAISQAVAAGLCIGIITAQRTPLLDRRAAELGITDVYQGNLNKIEPYEQFKREHRFLDGDVAYMGDDILDLSIIRKAGFAAAPANAHSSVRIAAHYVSPLAGGHGAVKDVIDLILRSRRSVH